LLRSNLHSCSAAGQLALAVPPGSDSVQAILLDIEGTTTPIDFVFRTLFPYARQRWGQFLLEHGDEPSIHMDLDALRMQHRADAAEQLNPPPWVDRSTGAELASATAYGAWLIDRDSKCSALKSIQGKIWQEGYRTGELRGEVYPDVPAALARWSREGKVICIFSSGSILAQKLLFGTCAAGDLTAFIRANFDTTSGPKNEPGSYRKIAEALALETSGILFISDIAKELDAARDAGMQTALCVRTRSSDRVASTHRKISSFDEIFADG
jgi:enolase-phosphatase E1